MTIATVLADKGDEVIAVAPTATLRALVELLTERRIGAVPVVEDGSVVGIMSERDIIHALRREGENMLDWPVERVMSRPPITATADTPVLAALSLMTRRRIRHLPVIDEAGVMIGFVSIGDLVKARIERIEQEAEAMRSYIAS
jgi:CBS domain-containing protein